MNPNKPKVLIVSPAAFIPDWQGSRKRVKQMIEVMEQLGFQVHFVFVRRSDQLDGDKDAMSRRLGGRFIELEDKKAAGRFSWWYWKIRLASKLRLYKACNIGIDDWYFDEITKNVKAIIEKENIDVVLLEYEYYSKLFEHISGVLKIMDMHDVFADRYKEFLRNGKRPAPWYSVSARDEKKAINRADIVLAIQGGDAAVFRSYGHPNVLTLSYAPEPSNQIKYNKSEKLRMCFLGTGNGFNRCALDYYLQSVHPALLSAGIDYELVVIGAVCEPFRNIQIEGNIKFLGRVADLEQELLRCDALVNSLASGTGLPIKVLDALACGLHVLATDAGARGLPMQHNLSAVWICNEIQDWVDAVQTLVQKKWNGVDLTADALRDIGVIQKDIDVSKQDLYKMLLTRLSGVGVEPPLGNCVDCTEVFADAE